MDPIGAGRCRCRILDLFAPPKFNSSLLKIDLPNRKGLSSITTIFQGRTVKLQGCNPKNPDAVSKIRRIDGEKKHPMPRS